MNITLVYATPALQKQTQISVFKDCSLHKAIIESGILQACPDIDLNCNKVGIWGKIVPLNTLLTEGDRVEIYRPLLLDPKQIRKLKAKRNIGSKEH